MTLPESSDLFHTLVDRWPLTECSHLAHDLLAAYGAASRGYHDQTHLLEVLDALAELARNGARFDILPVELAAWFHDAVYQGSDQDEELSAVWCQTALSGEGVDDATVAEAARLVRMTKTHDPAASDHNAAALSDADLAILAAPPERYRSYVAGVRADYVHVSDADFRRGRAQVLRDLVAGEHLFTTAYGRSVWEVRARSNVAAELAELDAGQP